ncbi:MAG: single-stranded DNA-binding protein [Gallionella sp.]|nr:single-stranded DNA-binding protein [Gallionella sp.]
MIRIEIKSPLINEISGVSKAGKPYNIKKQIGWAYLFDSTGTPEPFPSKIELGLADGQQPFAIGNYTISDKSYFVGDFNSLSIGRLILDPIK